MAVFRILFCLVAIRPGHALPLQDYVAHLPDPKMSPASVARDVLRSPQGKVFDVDLLNQERCGPSFCAGANATADSAFVCGDPRLGPAVLPSCLPLTSFFSSTNYSRFGGLCPGEFLAKWTQYPPASGVGSFRYPFADGFANDTTGVPIRGYMTLVPGTLVDRFGSVYGTFVAPAGTPYDQRALPPMSLGFAEAKNSSVTFSYHVYEVQKPVVVWGGPVASWFGQPGSGMQFELSTSVGLLVKDGVLEEMRVDERCVVKRSLEGLE